MNDKPKMKWWNLKDNKCPKCGSTLTASPEKYKTIICSKFDCEFSIGEQKMKEIVANQNSKNVDRRN